MNIPGDLLYSTDHEWVQRVEGTKSVSDIYAPVTGVVIEVNAALGDDPAAVNSDPYGNGWLCVIELSSPDELDQLLDASAYRTLTES